MIFSLKYERPFSVSKNQSFESTSGPGGNICIYSRGSRQTMSTIGLQSVSSL